MQSESIQKETKKKSDGPEVYYTRERIEKLVVVIITSMILTQSIYFTT